MYSRLYTIYYNIIYTIELGVLEPLYPVKVKVRDGWACEWKRMNT